MTMDILFFSPADWDGPKGRFQHLAERLAVVNRVIYVDGLGVRPLAARDLGRVVRKLTGARSTSRPAAVPPTNLTRVAPLTIPAQHPEATRAMNRSLLKSTIGRLTRKLAFDRPLLWISYPHPDLVDILDHFAPCAIVYDCVDDWPRFTGVYHNLEVAEQTLFVRADVVFTTAPLLQRKASAANTNVFLVPNGVDLSVFSGAPSQPADITIIPEPRIGFVGNIADWVDLDLVSDLARRRPEWQFVFIGDYQTSAPRPREDNLHWLGFRPYSDVPGYLSAFDVCLIPFVDNELTRSVDPLKVYEYLAAGKPVVSSPMPRMEEFAGVVRIARDVDGFIGAIEEAVAHPPAPGTCVAAVREHSWDNRYTEIIRLVSQYAHCNLGGPTEEA